MKRGEDELQFRGAPILPLSLSNKDSEEKGNGIEPHALFRKSIPL